MSFSIDIRSAGDSDCCGDFAVHVHLDGNRFAMFVGDVAGRGRAAGSAAESLKTYIHWAILNTHSLSECLRDVDDFFGRHIACEETPFATLILVTTDVRTGVVRYASAGHEPGLLFDDAGKHFHLNPTGPILGLQGLCQPVYGQRALLSLRNGLLVIVTDGITEARRGHSRNGNFFGSVGVVRAVHEAGRCREDTAHTIHRAASEHAGGILLDDASVAIARISAGKATASRRLIAEIAIRERHLAKLITNGYALPKFAQALSATGEGLA